ncbi:MAG: ROK family protein [Acidobacteriota bacterium]
MRSSHTLEELVFWYIYDRQHCLRSELTDHFSVSAATVSRAVTLLLDKELVVEAGTHATAPGRRPHVLEVNPKLATLAGLEIDVDRVTAVVTDMAGTLLGRGAVRCDAHQGLEKVLEASQEAVRQALADAGVPLGEVRHLGAGHPGNLDLEHGLCLFWPNVAGWRSVPLRDKLRERFGMEVTLDDRSRAVALAERRASGENGRHPNAIYVQVGTGIGMGVFVDGRLFRGATQAGGEIGNVVIDTDGPLCNCGNRGCVEAFATIGAVLRYVRDSLAAGASSQMPSTASNELTIESVAAAASRGDPLALSAFERAGTALGLGVSNVVQILNPSLVVLCGRLARIAGDHLVRGVSKAVRERCVEMASRRVDIRVAPPRKDISAVGCALLAAEAEAQRIVRHRLFGE